MLDDDRFAQLIRARGRDPEKPGELTRSRRRRPLVDARGMLFLVTAAVDAVVAPLAEAKA